MKGKIRIRYELDIIVRDSVTSAPSFRDFAVGTLFGIMFIE